MNISLFIIIICLLGETCTFGAPQNSNGSPTPPSNDDDINVNLIKKFMQTFKHIHLVTLLVCPSSSAQPQQSSKKLLINVTKQLMAAGLLIKVSDIDLVAITSTTTTATTITTRQLKQPPDVINDPTLNASMFPSTTMSNMLKSGDFKQAVVLQLSCRKSKFILQQVFCKSFTRKNVDDINTNALYFFHLAEIYLTERFFHRIEFGSIAFVR